MMRTEAAIVAALLVTVLSGCTGGQETNAAEEPAAGKNPIVSGTQGSETTVDATSAIRSISRVIPIYAGARFRDDLTRRDEVMIRNQFGPGTEVYTLATNDSYPQVFHYYTTYLAQFRGFQPIDPYPSEGRNWRTLEVQLNQAMQDPFIPGETIGVGGKQVTLQVVETETEPTTVVRYIVRPAPAATPAVAESIPVTTTGGMKVPEAVTGTLAGGDATAAAPAER